MKTFLLALFAGCISLVAGAQVQQVSGAVTDAANGQPLQGVTVQLEKSTLGTVTNSAGHYSLSLSRRTGVLKFSFIGYQTQKITIGKNPAINVQMKITENVLKDEVVVIGFGSATMASQRKQMVLVGNAGSPSWESTPHFHTEEYDAVHENRFISPLNHPFSTFSIDVDAASYSNVRRFINNGQLPPKDAVRVEEMINYFQYHYPQPQDKPVAIHTEMASCPWNPEHKLVMLGLQAKTIPADDLPSSNLVFLIDVSGSMWSPNKLPLVKSAMKLLTDQLRPQDKIAMVVYAGAAGVVLPSTSGNEKTKIKDAINKLEAGGSTAGGAGIQLAYQIARKNFIKGGNNRIILATDGDFNIGVSGNADMERLIEKERESGVYLTVLGFGMGNYKDSKMEILADKGNGNYGYIDNISEAKKMFIHEFGSTLFTVAKDVKMQVEFNPNIVQAYRLIGYENRLLHDEDFNNDKKDAGEMGSGYSVTALYEVIPTGVKSDFIEKTDPSKYQHVKVVAAGSRELMNVKLRYKDPQGSASRLITVSVNDRKTDWEAASENFRFAAAVAGFGMLLRDSEFKQKISYPLVLQLVRGGMGEDEEGYRHELLTLIKNAELLDGESLGKR